MLSLTATRLKGLIDKARGQAAFCRRVWPGQETAANKAKVSKWYKGDSGIRPDEAVTVAKGFDIRAAWILALDELPEREGVTRNEATLLDDVAAHVGAEVRLAIRNDATLPTGWRRRIDGQVKEPMFRGEKSESPQQITFDGALILKEAIEREAERVRSTFAEDDQIAKYIEALGHAERIRFLEGEIGQLRTENEHLKENSPRTNRRKK